jgi:dUTP pyrophosphatase
MSLVLNKFEIEDAMQKVEVKIKKLPNNIEVPFYATDGAAGMDLTAGISASLEFKPFERKIVPTGIIIELPKGYEAQVRPRSGLSIKFGMTLINCVGTIDEDYRGEVCVLMVNISQETYIISPGERIAQMIISPVTRAELVLSEELSDTVRASGGFGSTGK